MADALNSIEQWCHYVLPRQFHDPQGWELQNMLVVSRLVIVAASQREESRGVHLRSDFPDQDDKCWRRHLTFRLNAEPS
jgi:L-aspartate oxidase